MWGDNITLGESKLNEDNINLQNRCKYVRDHIDDIGYIMSKIKCKKVGKVYVGICPLPTHKEKTGSFTVYPRGYINKKGNKQEYATFYCFGCGEGGDVIRFKQLYDQLETREDACKELEKEHDIDMNDKDILKSLLEESLDTIKNTNEKFLNFGKVNYICSSICREYLNWIKNYLPDNINDEFVNIQKYYKFLDSSMEEITMKEAQQLIIQTENIIDERKNLMLNKI